MLLAACALAPVLAASSPANPDVLTIVLVGDVVFNKSKVLCEQDGFIEDGRVRPWATATEHIADLIRADLNFMNLETVITDRRDLKPTKKRFQKTPYFFSCHPNALEHLVQTGFNLISAGNNHTYDYGADGVRETLRHLIALQDQGRITYAGAGLDYESAGAPKSLRVKGATVAFSAIGGITNRIKHHRASANKPGSLGFRFRDDWRHVTARLGQTAADLRILSVHYGKEWIVRADFKQRHEWSRAAKKHDIDIIVGHHAHVVRGVERVGNRYIFYGMGNFLFRCARAPSPFPHLRLTHDYGMLAKLHVAKNASGDHRVYAVEVVPLRDMVNAPQRWPTKEANRRIEVVNALSHRLTDRRRGAVGLRFQIKDGMGLYCTEDASNAPEPIASLCRGYEPPRPPSRALQARVRRRR